MRKAIDWNAVKERIAQNQAAADEAQIGDPVRTAAIFEQRAKRLAERRTTASPDAVGLHVLTFALGAQVYAIEHAEIAEVLPLTGLTPVPGAAPELIGVVNLRGEILPVIDLTRLLETAGDTKFDQGYILVLRRQEIGLRVDAVSQIRKFSTAEIDTGLTLTEDRSKRYLKGITRDTTLILDVEMILTHSIFELT